MLICDNIVAVIDIPHFTGFFKLFCGFFTTSIIQVDQSNSTTNLLAQKPQTLVEQVFNSGLFKQKDSSLMGGMTSGKVMEPRLSEGRGRPMWALHDRESPISPLNMQVGHCALLT